MSRILIVDDTPLMRDALHDVLGMAGHEVVMAENGARALERIDEGETFDLIITDIIMPEMDGIQTIIEVRSRLPKTRIIAISGGSARLDKGRGLDTAERLGAVAVLEKPFEVDALLDAVNAALEMA